jgi:hypothetical protein
MRNRREFNYDDFRGYEDNFGRTNGENPFGYEPEVLRPIGNGGGGGGGRVSRPTPPIIVPKRPVPEISKPRFVKPILPPPPPIKPDLPPNPIIPIKIPPRVFVKGGCMDSKATNFDRRATYDNGKCRYPKPEIKPVVKDKNAPVTVTIASDRGPAEVKVNGKSVGTTNGSGDFHSKVLNFTEKELLSRKTITVEKAGFTSRDEWRISSKQKTLYKDVKPVIDIVRPDLPPPIRTNPQPTRGNVRNNTPTITATTDGSGQFRDYMDVDFLDPITEQFGRKGENINFGGNNPFERNFRGGINPNFNRLLKRRAPKPSSPKINFNNRLGIEPLFSRPVKGKSLPKPAPPKLSLGTVGFNYFEIVLERKINGKWVQQPNSNAKIADVSIRPKSHALRCGFSLRKSSVEIIEPPIIEESYSVSIIGDVPTDDTILWKTNYGQVGGVLDDDDIVTFKIERQEGDPIPSISFYANGITDFTHRGEFQYSSNGKKVTSRKGLETTIQLVGGQTDIQVQVFKNPIASVPTQPAVKLNRSSVKLNLADRNSVKISYESIDADSLLYILGKNKKTIPLRGTITLSPSDFPNGAGNYTLYVQPVSKRGGSGETQKVVIAVESKAYLPGPDITHINYPQLIKGADFKGYDADFNISWQSINTNYVEIYLDTPRRESFLGKFEPQGVSQLNIQDIIRKGRRFQTLRNNRDLLQFKILLIPYNTEGDSKTKGKVESINITFDKGDLTLRRGRVVGDIRNAFVSEFEDKGLDEHTSPFLTHYLHLGDGDNRLIGTWGIDETTFSDFRINPATNKKELYGEVQKSLVLKLYDPLPRNINPNDKIWISKIQSIPLIDRITITDDIVNNCTPLTPNFELDVTDTIGYQIMDDLITSGSTSSTDVVNQFVSSSNFSLDNLNIEFVSQSSIINEVGTGLILEQTGDEDYNWKEFIKYSSADERVQNFYYKVKLLESYQSKYDIVNSLTSSIATTQEAKNIQFKIGEVRRGFDSFEKYLYNESGSLTYPGAGENTLSSSDDSSTISWFAGILNSAQSFDYNNTSRLSFNLPKHIKDDENNSDFILFSDMIGQHFDVIYTHIKAISKSNRIENTHEYGIDDTMLYHMLESLGWNADMGVSGQALWEYAFGKDKDGNKTTSLSGKDRQNEIWRRLLNNLPYLYKHKGTKRAISAALSCYGVPASLLTVMEFGGPSDPDGDTPTKFTYDDRTASILLSGSAAITLPWKEHTSVFSDDYPNAVELRINSEQRQDQEIVSTDGWSLNLIANTGSLAEVQFKISGSNTILSSSTGTGSLFNDEYTQIVVQKVVSGSFDVFDVYAQESFQGRIRTKLSSSLEIRSGTNSWKSGSLLTLGGTNLTASVDEYRLWRTPLSQSRIDNHTLLPDAVDGNHISASSTDLLFRNDYEYPKNRYSSTSIKNVSIIQTYVTESIASNFTDISSYPFQYKSYDREVTAVVPSTGNSLGNKVRFETQTLVSDLNYRSRATKKSFDQSPVDSNRLGLFFSPTKEINMDIIRSLGEFNIDDYIGDPSDDYKPTYNKLNQLRNYYFDRYTLNIYEYIQLVRYIDQSLFKIILSLIPVRAQTSEGLLIEPHILERSKTEWKPSTAVKKDYKTNINVNDLVPSGETKNYLTVIDTKNSTNLSAESKDFTGVIPLDTSEELSADNIGIDSTILTHDNTVLSGENIGLSLSINNTEIGQSLSGEFESDMFTQIGTGPDSLSVAGFGLFGNDANAIRTRFDSSKQLVKERVKVFLLKKSYTVDIPENITQDSSQGTRFVTTTKFKEVVNILPFTGSDGNESVDPTVSGDIVGVTPLNGYFPTHYRNVGDLTSGLENSFFNGSKQTAATTLDGGSPIVTFTTNPNTLKVSDSGRGSGEPILEVD